MFIEKYKDVLQKIWSDAEIAELKEGLKDPTGKPWVEERLQKLQDQAETLCCDDRLPAFKEDVEDELADVQMFLQEAKCDPISGSAKKHM